MVMEGVREAGDIGKSLEGKRRCSGFYLDIQIDIVSTTKPGMKGVGEEDDLIEGRVNIRLIQDCHLRLLWGDLWQTDPGQSLIQSQLGDKQEDMQGAGWLVFQEVWIRWGEERPRRALGQGVETLDQQSLEG